MLDLNDVFYFVQVVDRGGFTSAGTTLRLPKSTLSHRIRELEAALGVRLLNRTSRQLSMTAVGAEFYQYAQEMLRTADNAEQAIKQRQAEPSGTIRLTTPIEIAQFALRDLIPNFLRQYPKVRIAEVSTDRYVDIVGEGFDIALRGHAGMMPDSSLVQRVIARVPWYIFGGRDYLARNGAPATPEEIRGHSTINLLRNGPPIWNLTDTNGTTVAIPIESRYISNNMLTLKEAACRNLGLAALPGYICLPELESGDLQQVLPGWIAQDANISTVMPYRVGIPPAVRALADFLANELPKATRYTPNG